MADAREVVRVVGRYSLHGAIASGGMATVHLGRLIGPVGFSRTVAIKRLHAQYAQDPDFVSMFLDEARVAARIRHPNVVPTLDVVATDGELFVVMEYVPGESLGRLVRTLRERGEVMPLRVVSAIMSTVLHGLHAAHEAKSERGEALGIVHRDVSPQNVLVGTDGVARVLDFGVAKAAGRTQSTRDGQIKGKLSYMAPEQLRGAAVSRQSDIYAAGVVLWELITGDRLFAAENEGALVTKVLEGRADPPSAHRVAASPQEYAELIALDAIALQALQTNPDARYATARHMALAIERAVMPAMTSDVSEWVEHVAGSVLHQRAGLVAEIESSASMQVPKHDVIMSSLGGANTPASGPVLAEAVRASMSPASAGDTQLSSFSVWRTARPPRRLPVAAFTIGMALAAVTLAAVFVVMALQRAHAPTRQSAAAEVVTAPATITPPADEKPAAPPPTYSPPPAASEPPVAATPTRAPQPPPPAAPRVDAPKPRAKPAAPAAGAPSPAAPSDCVYWDANGIKHVNPKCL